MKVKYHTTHLEDWIINLYQKLGLMRPEDIDIRKISMVFDIHLVYADGPSYSIEHGRFKCIKLNKESPKEVQREHFFHELCHLLRHHGRQAMMPKAFRELQEAQANTFVMYAALPITMLKNFKLSDPNIISILSDQFCVTEFLVSKRLQQIKFRLIQNRERIS